jgi:hypothetical protein
LKPGGDLIEERTTDPLGFGGLSALACGILLGAVEPATDQGHTFE